VVVVAAIVRQRPCDRWSPALSLRDVAEHAVLGASGRDKSHTPACLVKSHKCQILCVLFVLCKIEIDMTFGIIACSILAPGFQ
jgi:hypothetical protein